MIHIIRKLQAFLFGGNSQNQDTELHRERQGSSETLPKMRDSQNVIRSSMDDEALIDVPILIVGGGPTGLLLAYLLSMLGGKIDPPVNGILELIRASRVSDNREVSEPFGSSQSACPISPHLGNMPPVRT